MATKKNASVSKVQIKEAMRASVAEKIDSVGFLQEIASFAPRGTDEETATDCAGYVLLQLLTAIGYGSDIVTVKADDEAVAL